MIIIPAIDIIGGKCVRLTRGDYKQEKVYSEDPVEVAKKWESTGAKYLHIVDLDGAKQGMPANVSTIRQIIQSTKMIIQVGGGIRNLDSAEKFIDIGVNRIILGTVALENTKLLKKLVKEFKEKIIVSLDADNGVLMKKGWIEKSELDFFSAIQLLESIELKTIICTDTSRDGTLAGPNFKTIKGLRNRTKLKLIIAGGLSSINDVRKLKELSIDGVILGKSLYENKIDLKEALNVG